VAFRAGFCETCRIHGGVPQPVPELLPRVKTQVVRIMRRIVIRLPKIYVALYWWRYTPATDRFAKSLNGVNGRNKDFHRQGIPFVEGDVINFIVVVRPPETQHQLTGVEPLIGKTYNVSLHVSSDPYSLNPIPNL
jgi:hypothetical protein